MRVLGGATPHSLKYGGMRASKRAGSNVGQASIRAKKASSLLQLFDKHGGDN